MKTTDVLIAGAGPTGLVCALWLTKIGVKVRIIDKAAKAGTTSRAIVIHARNLEFYHQLGIAGMAVEKGIKINGGNVWKKGKQAAHISFSDLKERISPYQFMLGLPQDEQEELLQSQLARLGTEVERNIELTSYSQTENGIIAQLRKANGEIETCNAFYLAGCDGAHSMVREQMGAGFPGGTYEETFYVADLKARGSFVPGDVNIALDEADFLAIFPLKGADTARLVGTIRPEAIRKEQLDWKDVSGQIIQRLKIEVEEVNWFSTYRVHHRVASHFRKGNAFLLGDAGHLHSPVGGQGMNTGIGDAVNLAWKIGAVINDGAPQSILDTYEPERIAFARRLVASTDRAFAFISARGRFAKWVRLNIVPVLMPWMFGFVAVRRLFFRSLSQTSIQYRLSALSEGNTGRLSSGDRLPWIASDQGAGNFDSLVTMKWQAHIYGGASTAITEFCNRRKIAINVFPWNATMKKCGFTENAVYIVRPDGYVGMTATQANVAKLNTYCDKWGIGKSFAFPSM